MSIRSSISIRGFELWVSLGWPDDERLREQIVSLDIDIFFSTPPKACETDHLDDTFCYSDLTSNIRDNMTDKKFHLIEHLGCEIYRSVKKLLPEDAKLTIHLTKHPKVDGLKNGVKFSYGD